MEGMKSFERKIEAAVAGAINAEWHWPTEAAQRDGVSALTAAIMAEVSPLLAAEIATRRFAARIVSGCSGMGAARRCRGRV